MYRADLFRRLGFKPQQPTGTSSPQQVPDSDLDVSTDPMSAWMDAGCRYDPRAGGCEHLTLNKCIGRKRQGLQVIAMGLVVNWWGCEGQKNTSMCLWAEVSESMTERVASLDE